MTVQDYDSRVLSLVNLNTCNYLVFKCTVKNPVNFKMCPLMTLFGDDSSLFSFEYYNMEVQGRKAVHTDLELTHCKPRKEKKQGKMGENGAWDLASKMPAVF